MGLAQIIQEEYVTVQPWQLVHYEQYINMDVEVELHDNKKLIGKLKPYEQPDTVLVGYAIVHVSEIHTIRPQLLTC